MELTPRFKTKPTCKECNGCADFKNCLPVKKPLDQSYNGIRFTADGFDCALPVSIDSHTVCSYSCLYCFSEFLGGHVNNQTAVKQYDLDKFERILSGEAQSRQANAIRVALKRDQKQPCAVQLGALCDPFDNIERNQGWALRLPELLRKYNQPCRISTKGTLFLNDEYLDAFADPKLFWVAFSIITCDDELCRKIDKFAPAPSERIRAMARLASRGVSTSLRFRPLIPNVSDRTPRYPKAYKTLIEMAGDAGAKAVSMEAIFAPGQLVKESRKRWDTLNELIGFDLIKFYKNHTPKRGACVRLERPYLEDIFYEAREVAHKYGMTFGVSDPVMKHLNDTGCCCGIRPDDPVFGNWQRENATNAMVVARDEGKLVSAADGIPPWAHNVSKHDMCLITGPQAYAADSTSWADKLRDTWNDLKTNRGVLLYFQGALRPVDRDANGDIRYRYQAPAKGKPKYRLYSI